MNLPREGRSGTFKHETYCMTSFFALDNGRGRDKKHAIFQVNQNMFLSTYVKKSWLWLSRLGLKIDLLKILKNCFLPLKVIFFIVFTNQFVYLVLTKLFGRNLKKWYFLIFLCHVFPEDHSQDHDLKLFFWDQGHRINFKSTNLKYNVSGIVIINWSNNRPF